MKKISAVLIAALLCGSAYSQRIPLPADLPQDRPRLMTTPEHKPALEKTLRKEKWAQEVMKGILERIDPYVEKVQKEPDWVYSRLMMYWKSKATNVYIRGGVYSHADGEAPVPTVRFGSMRGMGSPYKRPALEAIIPYMDDTKGVYFLNTAKEGSPLEWIEQGNVSDRNIENVNNEILRLGRDAAFVYWMNGEEKYATFAYDILDTYLTGLYYRNEPVDLNNGHAGTLAGLTTFEVIQEGIIPDVAAYYDFLHPYIKATHGDKLSVFEAALKKWIDLTIKNGVPQNNWNLHQANLILSAAMVLEDNRSYSDGKGREYYIDYILNKSSTRQWSFTRLMEYGYDYNTGIWNECPNYAQSVTESFMHFLTNYDNTFNQNLLPYAPVMKKAVEVLPQYIFPNGYMTAFGDGYYGPIGTKAISDVIRLSQKYDQKEDEKVFTRMYKLFVPNADAKEDAPRRMPADVSSFFTRKPLELDKSVEKGTLKDYVTQTFYAPNVSWFVQRSNYEDKQNGLMISQYASYGNHAHSNGVAMELYGKGYVLGAESGIGSTYFEKPYLEYYSQFPAHNTVMVDGISKYPEMLSNHPFDLVSCYPEPGLKEGYYPEVTFSEVYFLEPESRSDQNRLLSIVRTGESTGYYVDIFRSKKQREGDKFHDYYYHNLGQELFIQNSRGENLELTPNDEIAFAGGHLFALDYMWDKQSVKTGNDYQAVWKMSMPDQNHVYMNLWMKGYADREVFSIKSPSCKAFRSNSDFPYEVNKAPFLTIAARQHGEAWNRPFVSVFEPATEKEGKSVRTIESFEAAGTSPDFVGLKICSKSGRIDYLFSSVKEEKAEYNQMSVHATYALVSETGNDFVLFMGNGTSMKAKGFTISSNEKTTAVLEYKNGEYYLTCNSPVTIAGSKGTVLKFGKTPYSKVKL